MSRRARGTARATWIVHARTVDHKRREPRPFSANGGRGPVNYRRPPWNDGRLTGI